LSAIVRRQPDDGGSLLCVIFLTSEGRLADRWLRWVTYPADSGGWSWFAFICCQHQSAL